MPGTLCTPFIQWSAYYMRWPGDPREAGTEAAVANQSEVDESVLTLDPERGRQEVCAEAVVAIGGGVHTVNVDGLDCHGSAYEAVGPSGTEVAQRPSRERGHDSLQGSMNTVQQRGLGPPRSADRP